MKINISLNIDLTRLRSGFLRPSHLRTFIGCIESSSFECRKVIRAAEMIFSPDGKSASKSCGKVSLPCQEETKGAGLEKGRMGNTNSYERPWWMGAVKNPEILFSTRDPFTSLVRVLHLSRFYIGFASSRREASSIFSG